VKSQLVKESLSKSVSESSLEPTLESLPSVNNNNENGQQSPQLGQSRSQSMPVRGLCSVMPLHNPRTGILWERDCN
jgi:hypothetical protein